MQNHQKYIPWFVFFVLTLAVLACSLSDIGSERPQQELQQDEPIGLVTVAYTAAPTWTLIPTFTAVSVIEPMPTQEPIIEQPTATEEPIATEELAPPQPTENVLTSDTNRQDGAAIVYIPAGEFLMGSDAPGANPDEKPAHWVYLDAFWLYQAAVTNIQYRQCITDGACEGSLGRYPENNLPAVNVTWFEAVDYCQWAGGALPTEAQWEKGARGSDGRAFPWGDGLPTCDLANYKNCYGSKEIAVNRLPAGASPYGALQMAGNVWEWVRDWYDPEYYGVSPDTNPTGPAQVEEKFRVQRGGSFESDPNMLYASIRSRSGPEKADYRKGFRCVINE